MSIRLIFTVLLFVLLVGCTTQEEVTPEPTPEPPALSMVVLPARPVDDADITALESALLRETDLVIDVVTVERPADLLKALCTEDDLPTMAWVDGLMVSIVRAQRCGVPDLQVARNPQTVSDLINNAPEGDAAEAEATEEATPEADATEEAETEDEANPEAEATEETETEGEATPEAEATEEAETEDEATEEAPEIDLSDLATGSAGQIVVSDTLQSPVMASISGQPFCRLNVSDFYSWLLPVLTFDSVGIDLAAAASDVRDYEDLETMLDDVSNGTCAYAGVREGTPLPSGVTVLQTTPPIPFGVLMSASDVQLGVRLSLQEKLVEMAENDSTADLMRPFLMQDALLPVEEDTFADFDSFLNTTGLDLSQIGQ